MTSPVRPELWDVTAGLYIGEAPDTTYPRVLTERSAIRSQRPDILMTNYKMLDLLLPAARISRCGRGGHPLCGAGRVP